jgi:EpsI family protein
MKKLKFVFIIILLIASGAVSWNVYFRVYTQEDAVNIHHYPSRLGDWESRDLPMSETEYAILETRNVFVREYKNRKTGGVVYLFIVYSENNRKVSHPPEICYTGSGFLLVNKRPDTLESRLAQKGGERILVSTQRLLLEQGPFEQIAHYWFKVGPGFTSSYWKQQWMIVFNTVFGKSSSSALIRISTDVKDGKYEEAEQHIRSFANEAIPLFYRFLP